MRLVDLRLGLDTATPYLSLALWSQGDTLASRRSRIGREHAAVLLPQLEELLSEAGVGRGEVRAVTVGVGPGSYTGVRVGLAAARALATAWSVPLGGASTLAQIAWGALSEGESGAAAVDARRGNVYAALYRRSGDDLVELAPARKATREELKATWRDARWLEDLPPDASWAARQAPGHAPSEAVYL